MRVWEVLALLAFAALVYAQQTTTMVIGGQTVVADIFSTQNGNGQAVTSTSIIRTLANDPIAGAPPPTDVTQGPIVYYVTKWDEDGNTIVETYTYTPTFVTTGPPVTYPRGTIADYSQWTAIYATRTSYPHNGASGPPLKAGLTAYAVTAFFVVVGMFIL